jgi:hypothetical protein
MAKDFFVYPIGEVKIGDAAGANSQARASSRLAGSRVFSELCRLFGGIADWQRDLC